MTAEWIHPGFVLILGAWFLPLFRGTAKRAVLVALPAAALLATVLMTPGTYGVVRFLGQEVVFGRVDALSLVFCYVFALMALIGIIFALHVDDDAQHIAALTYAGSALGATLSGDFLSLFLFWELMALSAALLVWLRRKPEAGAAGFRYLMVHVFGGLCLFGGIVLHWSDTGSLVFSDLTPYAGGAAFTLILIAFLLNAAVPPLGAWLPDAYPEATVTGAVFLTAFTTKSAVYTLIRGFAGTEILMWWGAGMAVYGVVYAVLENDARRLLAYHIVSQVGYMVCGVGIGTALALNGSSAHAFAHILYKAVLFMGAGAVLQMTGLRKLSDMGGLHKTMPWTLTLYMVGAFAISAVPLFSGFVSKSMVVSAAGEAHHAGVFLVLTLASAGTFLHTGLKLPWYMFFGEDRGIRAKEPPTNMLVAMGIAAAACILIGVFPSLLYAHLPFPADYVPYTVRHVLSTLGLLAFTALGFFLLLKQLDPEPTISLDTDWFYRRGLMSLLGLLEDGFEWLDRVSGRASDWVVAKAIATGEGLRALDSRVVDAATVGIGKLTVAVGGGLRLAADGNAQHYGLLMAVGALAALAVVVFGL
jgi:multicomponent Na+:H+ antiporter subunit D